MKIKTFIWLDEIVDKLEVKHRISREEVVCAFKGRTHFRFVEKGDRKGEDLYAAMGRAYGRYVIVFFIYKKDNKALIISARDMTKGEKKLYEKN